MRLSQKFLLRREISDSLQREISDSHSVTAALHQSRRLQERRAFRGSVGACAAAAASPNRRPSPPVRNPAPCMGPSRAARSPWPAAPAVWRKKQQHALAAGQQRRRGFRGCCAQRPPGAASQRRGAAAALVVVVEQQSLAHNHSAVAAAVVMAALPHVCTVVKSWLPHNNAASTAPVANALASPSAAA